jgi:ribonuclease D
MQLTDTITSATVTEHGVAAEQETIQQCDECGAPVDKLQRYCVACGAHRRHVNDPAARYLSQATARSRSKKAAATRKEPGGVLRHRGLILALAIALIPVAAAAGVIAGRSSNNNDAKLIRALAAHQNAAADTTTVPASTADGSTTAATTAAHVKKSKHKAKAAAAKVPSVKNAGKVLTKTKNGTAQQITGFRPTQAQEQQGSSETKKVQKSTGKNYVNGQNNLPSQVVVP